MCDLAIRTGDCCAPKFYSYLLGVCTGLLDYNTRSYVTGADVVIGKNEVGKKTL